MSSEAALQAAIRHNALQTLRFKKNAKAASRAAAISSDSPLPSSSSTSTYSVPSQSRDATAHSSYTRVKPTEKSTNSAVVHDPQLPLVIPPDSSHMEKVYKPHQSQFFTSPPSSLHELPSLPRVQRNPDPLFSRSGFTRSDMLSVPSATGSTTTITLHKRLEEDGDDENEGPPRKRVNRGLPVTSPITISSSPDTKNASMSTRVQRVGPTESSDSDLPNADDILKTPPPTRIKRGIRPDEKPRPPQTSIELNMFIMTLPEHDPLRVSTAYRLCDGDTKAALALIKDSTWNHRTPSMSISTPTMSISTPTRSLPQIPPTTGSVGRRAVEKEKGKKSAIYARRPGGLTTKTMSPSKESVITITDSPIAPKPAKRRAMKRVVASSGSEEYSSDDDGGIFTQTREDQYYYDEALKWLNACEASELVELAGITLAQANTLISLRPFPDADDLTSKLSRRNKTGLSSRLLENLKELFKGYKCVDDVLEGCERVGEQLRDAIAKWSNRSMPTASTSKATTPEDEDGALTLVNSPLREAARTDSDYIVVQPSLLSEAVQLKEYQLTGVNWMHLLYRRNLSCILADEMGLGKTVQVIAFLALLKERGQEGPHLIIVPSSTLENWIREFMRFAPPIEVVAYYGSQKDRVDLRHHLRTQNWNVMITTYNLAQGDERDRKFFRKFEWQCCIFDEGHVLKNFDSQRYVHLMRIESRWRLLLTGTPLQNNLQELVSLMNFILPRYFMDVIDNLRAIFKVKADRQSSLLARDRVSRAKKMMTPFVLRRRKDMVLKDLPKKSERIEWCEMTPLQKSIYRDALKRSRKAVLDALVNVEEEEDTKGKGKKKGKDAKKSKDTSTNVLMDLRKAASHPMLFRRLFDDSIIKMLAKQCMKEPEFMDSNYQYIVEDMEVMTDAELQAFCLKYESIRKFAKDAQCFEDAGKISKLLELLDDYHRHGRRTLIFSQFTQILDILQAVLRHRNMKFLVLTGSTAVDVRQSLVDEFNEDESISVFLLSTKAGGMGINLTAASVVILFDQDFNPHNDRQAADRAYRIGQKQDVDVIKLISSSTIEEDMYRLGQTKLALDEAVAGDDIADGDGDEKVEKRMRTSLLSVLREQFEKEELQANGGSRGQSMSTPNSDMELDGDTSS